jgi:uncharacterized membrane protein
LAARTGIGLGDIAVALASGGAGALAFTAGVSTVLVGVMVAVALLPPLAALGCSWVRAICFRPWGQGCS